MVITSLAQPIHAQVPLATSSPSGGPFNYLFVEGTARTILENKWDDTKDPAQVERVYCILPNDVVVDTSFDHSAVDWHVKSLTVPDSVLGATPFAIDFHCPPGTIADVHIHSPATCARVPKDTSGRFYDCVFGGKDAYLCQMDEWDQFHVRHFKQIFGFVQCDKHAFVVYWAGGRRG